MRGYQDRTSLGRQLGDQPLEPRGARRVETAEGLVEQQHRRLANKRTCDEHALALAARELAERRLRLLLEADIGERRRGAGAVTRVRGGGTSERAAACPSGRRRRR